MRKGNISGGTFTIPTGWNLNFDVFPPICNDCGSYLQHQDEACSFCLKNNLRTLLKQVTEMSSRERMRAMMQMHQMSFTTGR